MAGILLTLVALSVALTPCVQALGQCDSKVIENIKATYGCDKTENLYKFLSAAVGKEFVYVSKADSDVYRCGGVTDSKKGEISITVHFRNTTVKNCSEMGYKLENLKDSCVVKQIEKSTEKFLNLYVIKEVGECFVYHGCTETTETAASSSSKGPFLVSVCPPKSKSVPEAVKAMDEFAAKFSITTAKLSCGGGKGGNDGKKTGKPQKPSLRKCESQ